MVMKFAWVALGGGLGSVLRLGVGMMISHRLPFATLAVNFVGSLLIGMMVRNVDHGSSIYYFGVVGLCGGFTTFSTFSLDVLKLLKAGDTAHALWYMALSLLICIAAVALGSRIKLS